MFSRFLASLALFAFLSYLAAASPAPSPAPSPSSDPSASTPSSGRRSTAFDEAGLEPFGLETDTLARRTDPVFPDSPPSCPICQQGYPNIQSCAQAAPVLANFSMIIFNPGAFIDVIKCACADTFQSVFPQCVDCFTQTGQQDVISTSNLPGLVGSIKNICGLESTLLGNVSAVNSANANAPQPTQASSGATAVVAGGRAGSGSVGLGVWIGVFVLGLVVL